MKKFIAVFLAIIFLSYSTVIAGETTQLAGNGGPEIKAPSAILMDLNTKKILFEKNSKEVRLGTSVMKIMNMLLVAEAIDSGKIKLSDNVDVSEDASKIGGANVWLKSHETLPVSELLKSISMVSANDACIALAEKIAGSQGKFVSMMNERASQLGMQNTVFKDCIGSDEDGNVTTAYDIALMSAELMKHRDITEFTTPWIDYIRDGNTQIVNSNKLLKLYSGTTGLKTGTTQKAGSCISATAEKGNVCLVVVALGCENTKDRYSDAIALLNHGFSDFEIAKPNLPDNIPKVVKVTNGMKSEIALNTEKISDMLVPKGKTGSIKTTFELSDEIIAPVDIGFKVGKIVFKLDDEVIMECDVTAREAVDEITFNSVFKMLISKFFEL